ncbi:MAG TPA: hypothetical protein VN039_05670 [Nitrospira sp.]|nr:hypothetical protein [Nitrospira sp.]
MSRSHGLLTLLAVVMLGGCREATKPIVPQTITVTVTKYVPLDSALTEDCPISLPLNRTVSEAVRIARARRVALEDCTQRMRKIRELQPKADGQ